MKLRFKASSAAAGLLAGLVAAGSIVWASVDSGVSDEQWCRTRAGYLRFAGAGECRRSELSVALPQGVQGPAGPRGEVGPQGPQGLQGNPGVAPTMDPTEFAKAAADATRCAPSALQYTAYNFMRDCKIDWSISYNSLQGDFRNSDWSDAKIGNLTIANGDFSGADLSGARSIERLSFSGSDLINMSLAGQEISGSLELTSNHMTHLNLSRLWTPFLRLQYSDKSTDLNLSESKLKSVAFEDFSFPCDSAEVCAYPALNRWDLSGSTIESMYLGITQPSRGVNINIEGASFLSLSIAGTPGGAWSVIKSLCGFKGTPRSLPTGWQYENGCFTTS